MTEEPPGSGNYQTNAVVDPKLENAIGIGRVINEATKPFNPFSPLVEIALGAIAAGATWFAKRKNDQLRATIVGVEAKGGEEVKAAIRSAAIASGVEGGLNKAVRSITGPSS